MAESAQGGSSGGGAGGGGKRAKTGSGKDKAQEAEEAAAYLLMVNEAPGAELLNDHEKKLCASLRLLPKYYLVVKDALLREAYRLGYLTKTRAHQLVKIEVSATDELVDFFVSCGWVEATEG